MGDEREFPYEFSKTLGAMAKALAAAQGEIRDAKKDAVNPHFKNKYATLSSVRDAITAVFSKHELAVTQLNEPHGDAGVCVVTLLMHSSGEWIRSRLFMPVTKKDAQGFGSALSYARRYALASIANISSDEDDDAEVAAKPSPVKAAPPATTGIDVAALEKALKEAKDAQELADASKAVGVVVGKLDPKIRDHLRGVMNETTRRVAEAS